MLSCFVIVIHKLFFIKHSPVPSNLTSCHLIQQVLVVDVDESRVLQGCGDESTVLPPRLCRGLRDALQCAIPDKNTPLTPEQNLIASEALIALFVQLVGHYRDHIITSSATGQRDFQVTYFTCVVVVRSFTFKTSFYIKYFLLNKTHFIKFIFMVDLLISPLEFCLR